MVVASISSGDRAMEDMPQSCLLTRGRRQSLDLQKAPYALGFSQNFTLK
jgi:hypothetical protein